MLALRRFTFGVLQALLPAVAERWAALQFVTPQRVKPEPESTLDDGAFTVAAGAQVAFDLPAHSHSIGGTATGLALRHGLPADRVVLLAPAAEPTYFVRGMASQLGQTAPLHHSDQLSWLLFLRASRHM